MEMNKLNNDYYDGKITSDDIYKNIKEYFFNKPNNYRMDNFTTTVNCMININWSPISVKMLKLLLNDRKHNKDPSDNLDAEYLLCLIWEKLKNNPINNLYVWEQIEDISNEKCPQGRCKRLFSIVKSLYFNEISQRKINTFLKDNNLCHLKNKLETFTWNQLKNITYKSCKDMQVGGSDILPLLRSIKNIACK